MYYDAMHSNKLVTSPCFYNLILKSTALNQYKFLSDTQMKTWTILYTCKMYSVHVFL